MHFFDSLQLMATGYITKKKDLYGKDVHFTFRSKSDYFDPFRLILDQYFKITLYPKISHNQLNENFTQLTEVHKQAEDKKAKVIVKIPLDMGLLKIKRLVIKEQKRTTSLYMAFLEEKLLFSLHKKYDYGNELQEVLNIIDPLNTKSNLLKNQLENNNLFVFENSQNEMCFIEKLVHTHVFYVSDSTKFEKVCEELKTYPIQSMSIKE